jgi:2-polyprenyl-3-methyl-5-hydroxy-6-metoxy-1,4-benzoquinol methylase
VNDATAHALNALNRSFYRDSAERFAETRSAPWLGWRELLPLLRRHENARVLDVGCGNGRLARFLAAELGAPFLYCGIDASAPLLARAADAIAGLPGARLLNADVVLDPALGALHGERFDCVAVFGLLHHVPGEARRRALVAALAERIEPGGILALAFWDFAREPRFAAKIVGEYPPELGQLEPGDVLLRWGPASSPALRYCHHTDEAEEARLLAGLPLQDLRSFASDGRNGRLNRYRVLERC